MVFLGVGKSYNDQVSDDYWSLISGQRKVMGNWGVGDMQRFWV